MSRQGNLISGSLPGGARVLALRRMRGWSQQDLADRSGLSRAAVSAIEIGRVDPSVAAALRLSAALGRSVEELFGADVEQAPSPAWSGAGAEVGWWLAEAVGGLRYYPFEGLTGYAQPLDRRRVHDNLDRGAIARAKQTLVVAGCDPAMEFLVRELDAFGVRALAFQRTSRQALELLRAGLVHVAGVHFSSANGRDENALAVCNEMERPCELIRYSHWEEGLMGKASIAGRKPNALCRSRLRWIGREPGSGIGQMLADAFGRTPLPRRQVGSHRAVAAAIQAGLADIGPGLRLTAIEAGLAFVPMRRAAYEYCVDGRMRHDPRVERLLTVMRGPSLRRQLSDLPGFDCTGMGECRAIVPKPAAAPKGLE